jgi:hypothetical protein
MGFQPDLLLSARRPCQHGAPRAAAHDIEARLSAVRNPSLAAALLGVRLHEKDYLQGNMRDAVHKVEPLVASVFNETRKRSQSQVANRDLLLSIFAIMIAGLPAGGEMSTSTEQLSGMAQELQKLVAQFKIELHERHVARVSSGDGSVPHAVVA